MCSSEYSVGEACTYRSNKHRYWYHSLHGISSTYIVTLKNIGLENKLHIQDLNAYIYTFRTNKCPDVRMYEHTMIGKDENVYS